MTQLAARVASLFQVRQGEGRLVGLVAAFFAFLEVGRSVGANAADGLFFIRFGVAYLPIMTIALGALTFVVTLSYTVGLGRYARGRFFVAVLGVFGGLLLVERAALFLDLALLFPVLWLTINVMSAVVGTLMWNVAAEVCDTRQAKRLFSLFTSAGIFGGVVGNLLTGALAKSIGTENLLLLYALLLLAALAASRLVARAYFKPATKHGANADWRDELRVGFDFVRGSRLMQLIAAASILFSVLYFSVYIPFSQVASASYPNEADLAGFLGLVSSAITVLTLIVSLFVANRLYARVGVVNGVLLLPVTYLVGFFLFASSSSLAAAVAVRMAQMVVMNGIAGSAWNALFNVVPPEQRGQVQSFDGGVTAPIGTMLSGLIPLLATRLLTTTQMFVGGMIVAAATSALVWQMRRDYGRALVDALRSGFLDVFTATRRGFQSMGADASARQAILAGLADAQPARRRLAAEVLGKMGDRAAVEPLSRALGDAEVDVRCAALDALVQLNAVEATDEIARRVGDADPSVRAEALNALSRLSSLPRPEFGAAIEDPDPMVRARAAAALARTGDALRARAVVDGLLASEDPAARAAGLNALADGRLDVPTESIAGYLRDEASNVRLAAVAALGARRVPEANVVLVEALDNADEPLRLAAAAALQDSGVAVETLLHVLQTGSDRAQHAALIALSHRGSAARRALIDWALAQIPRAAQLRGWSASLASADGAASRSQAFVQNLLRQQEWRVEQRVLQALALIGTAESIKLISQGLRSRDPEMRAQALEALDTLGDKRIARGLLPLLEETSRREAAPDVRTALKEMTEHADPWLRAFAVRALGELLRSDWEEVAARSRADPAPLVREAGAIAGMDGAGASTEVGMKETLRTLGTMDRILFLQQVPLFGELSPEDLQQIAQTAAERVFSGNEFLCREGEIGDELFVIVDGHVRVAKGSNGESRTLRTLQTGEHIGELAILREQPRSASVIAEDGGVRTLAIRGAALKSILRDRPEVALAMLSSLAQRMSTLT